MSLVETKKQIGQLERYLRLENELEDVVDDSLKSILAETRDYLEDSLRSYRKIFSLEEKALRIEAQTESDLERTAYKISEKYGLDPENVRKLFSEEDKKSDYMKRFQYSFRLFKNTVLALISTPFSKERSVDYRELARIYSSALQNLKEYNILKKENNKAWLENIREKSRLEQSQARNASSLVSDGVDEAIAEHIVLNPDSFVFFILDLFKERYGLNE